MSHQFRYFINKRAYKKINSMIGGEYENHYSDNFYIVHSVAGGEKQLIRILDDSYLRAGKDVEHPHILSGLDLDYVYTNINFDDINNIWTLGGCRLLFRPELLYDYGGIFNTHWNMVPDQYSIYVHKGDNIVTKYKQIQNIKKCILNPPINMPVFFRKNIGIMHELLFDQAIPLSKYLIGVECEQCSDGIMNKINYYLKEKYPNVVLITKERINNKIEPPKLKDILEKNV